jgi:hypothetical protein
MLIHLRPVIVQDVAMALNDNYCPGHAALRHPRFHTERFKQIRQEMAQHIASASVQEHHERGPANFGQLMVRMDGISGMQRDTQSLVRVEHQETRNMIQDSLRSWRSQLSLALRQSAEAFSPSDVVLPGLSPERPTQAVNDGGMQPVGR